MSRPDRLDVALRATQVVFSATTLGLIAASVGSTENAVEAGALDMAKYAFWNFGGLVYLLVIAIFVFVYSARLSISMLQKRPQAGAYENLKGDSILAFLMLIAFIASAVQINQFLGDDPATQDKSVWEPSRGSPDRYKLMVGVATSFLTFFSLAGSVYKVVRPRRAIRVRKEDIPQIEMLVQA